jgi:hypothetical protein
MWIPATFAYLVAALALFASWLWASEERVHAQELAREAARHGAQRTGDDRWP